MLDIVLWSVHYAYFVLVGYYAGMALSYTVSNRIIYSATGTDFVLLDPPPPLELKRSTQVKEIVVNVQGSIIPIITLFNIYG